MFPKASNSDLKRAHPEGTHVPSITEQGHMKKRILSHFLNDFFDQMSISEKILSLPVLLARTPHRERSLGGTFTSFLHNKVLHKSFIQRQRE